MLKCIDNVNYIPDDLYEIIHDKIQKLMKDNLLDAMLLYSYVFTNITQDHLSKRIYIEDTKGNTYKNICRWGLGKKLKEYIDEIIKEYNGHKIQ